MYTLKETEWLTVNNVLLDLYDISDIEEFTGKVLRIFRMLIPYYKGYFIVFDENDEIRREYSAHVDMDDKIYDIYINSYFEKDYLKYAFEISTHTITYQDSDIIEDEMRKKTDFYRDFLEPNRIPYGAGVLLRSEGRNIGVVNFFRNENLGDFSDKDMFILDVLKNHLSHMLVRLIKKKKEADVNQNLTLQKITMEMGLSNREEDVLSAILEGMSNAQIAENLSISLSTVKKHVYNIFTKFGVSTRAQLKVAVEKKRTE